MPRPKEKDRSLVREKQVLVRARAQQYKRWEARARKQGVPPESWARSVLDRAADVDERVSVRTITLMSRPPEKNREFVRTDTVRIRITPLQRKRWEAMARKHGMTLSTWLRSVANRAARTG